ncbi:hypothetical protein [Leptospira koniambonensis]|uniref:hypothetical protein n=1 Tax=Leptospira koniambonensis TaxID=2484950 RepID=UPI003EB80845
MHLLEIIQNGQFTIIENTIAVAADGGTVAFILIDSRKDKYTFYLDRRIESETINHFYINEYPGSIDSLSIGENPTLLAVVERMLKTQN